jgi:uncharacterized protein VirK/YbjX
MDTELLHYVGYSLYQTQYLKEMKRYLVFRARCRMHQRDMEGLIAFFNATPLRKTMLHGTPSFIEQATRAFFYKGSDYTDRIALIENHVEFLEHKVKPEFLQDLYGENKHLTCWQDTFKEEPLKMDLYFHGGQRKEGCLSLSLFLGKEELYQIMFWLGPDTEKEPSLWIGALQGPVHANDVIKALTKDFFGYRTKNLIFYGIRNVARCLGVARVYAVTNEGYYAMNHLRSDRKLKTSFTDFWQECEGVPAKDAKFYLMPVSEHRKDMSELKPSKRAQHRRRFERLDKIDAAFTESFKQWLR